MNMYSTFLMPFNSFYAGIIVMFVYVYVCVIIPMTRSSYVEDMAKNSPEWEYLIIWNSTK